MGKKIKLCPLINQDCCRLKCEWWCKDEEFIENEGYCSIKGISLFASIQCKEQDNVYTYLKILSRSVDEMWRCLATKFDLYLKDVDPTERRTGSLTKKPK